MDLLPKEQKVQESDTTGDHMKNKSWPPKNISSSQKYL